MKKRWLSLALALCMVLTLLPASAFAADIVDSGNCGAQGDNVTWTLDSDGNITITGNGAMMGFPPSHSPFYDNRSTIRNAVIRPGVTSIGRNTFEHCEQMDSVTIPDGVTIIDDGAFDACYHLASAPIPDSVTRIGSAAFHQCGLRSISIPDSVTSIGEYALAETMISSISIPDGVTSISCGLFLMCYGLESVVLPNSLISIGDNAFDTCPSMTSFTIPDGVTSIGKQAFNWCTQMKSITIPDSVTSIGDSAFEDCFSLTSITIPDGVAKIGESTFENCYELTSITIPESVTSIGSSAFYNSGLTDVYYRGTQEQWSSISIAGGDDRLRNATIHYNYKDGMIQKGKYCIRVVDENGTSISDATVTWNASNALTDSNGCAYFPQWTDSQPSVTVEKDGYDSWTNAHSN